MVKLVPISRYEALILMILPIILFYFYFELSLLLKISAILLMVSCIYTIGKSFSFNEQFIERSFFGKKRKLLLHDIIFVKRGFHLGTYIIQSKNRKSQLQICLICNVDLIHLINDNLFSNIQNRCIINTMKISIWKKYHLIQISGPILTVVISAILLVMQLKLFAILAFFGGLFCTAIYLHSIKCPNCKKSIDNCTTIFSGNNDGLFKPMSKKCKYCGYDFTQK